MNTTLQYISWQTLLESLQCPHKINKNSSKRPLLIKLFVDKIKHYLKMCSQKRVRKVKVLLYLKLNGTVGSDVDCYGKYFHPSGGCSQISGAGRHLARRLVLLFGLIIRFLGFFLPWLIEVMNNRLFVQLCLIYQSSDGIIFCF